MISMPTMDKEARGISTVSETAEKPSTADRWRAVEQKLKSITVEQPNGSSSNQQLTSGQGQSGPAASRRPTVRQYLDRITVAGLHNYLYAVERYEKVTWHFTFLIAILGTMFYFVTTIRTYLEFTIVLDIRHGIEPSVHLPNVWVCMDSINVSYISEHFDKIRPKLLVDRRIRLHAKRYVQRHSPKGPFYSRWNSTSMTYETVPSVWNVNTTRWEYTVDDMVDTFIFWSKHFSIISPVGDDFGLYNDVAHVLAEILYVAVELSGADRLVYKTFYEDGMFSCESVLNNCTLNGVAFDCCVNDTMGYSQGSGRCFRLDIAPGASQQPTSSSITLSFETIIDSVYLREFRSSAYWNMTKDAAGSEAGGIWVSFGPRMPGLFEISQQLAASTVSSITVRAKKKVEKTGCVQAYRFDLRRHIDSHPLIINYFKEMIDPDQYTVGTCEMGELLDAIYTQCGCVLYYDTIRPRNDSVICTPTHMYACLYKTFHDVSPNDKPQVGNLSAGSGAVSSEDEFKRSTMTQLKLASAAECLPLCESWTYDYRASSMIAAGPEGNVSRYFRNKVTVIFDPEYRVETEVYKMDYTTLIASLGDGFALILGISAVTLIQLPIWTVAAMVLRRKLNKISPLQRQGAIHNRSVYKESDV